MNFLRFRVSAFPRQTAFLLCAVFSSIQPGLGKSKEGRNPLFFPVYLLPVYA